MSKLYQISYPLEVHNSCCGVTTVLDTRAQNHEDIFEFTFFFF